MNNSLFSISGKNIVISGASSGIGQQCAISCSKSGARIILLGRNRERLEDTLLLLEGEGHIIYSVDILEYFDVKAVVESMITSIGKVDSVINCAGISGTYPFLYSKPEKLDIFFRTNVTGGMNLTRLLTKKGNFSDDGGSVVFISSVMGSAGEIGKSMYCMTKGAIDAGVRALALELAPRKIRINSISPGVVITPMSQKAVYSRDEEALARISNMHPLGTGNPGDIANASIFLLSDAARWITGINLVVDGGYLAR